MRTEEVILHLDEYLRVQQHPDYPTALNGLQVEGPAEVTRVAAAVDASEATIGEAVARGAQLLIVHHGLFWDGLRPLTGRRYRKLARLLEGGVALYSVHLPLDSHPEVGNCALLARAIGVEPEGGFGVYKDARVGWWGSVDLDRGELETRVAAAVGGGVRLIAGGPQRLRRVAVVTGGGGSFVEEAALEGMDALVTGEGSHHTYGDAMELGVNLYYGGHYATETFGVRALAAHLEARFGLSWEFIDVPSGL
jgi:dinuclear metal center YbgI/SA1388 family protein